ncbi:MAG: GNAT family N-acetyltransferase [Clostridiaceae bacterium]|nr:GNAT family N-acetyltransferase [Clostridiaceae bacterium]
MTFRRTKNFSIYLSEKDSSQLSSPAKITAALKSENVIAFNIYIDDALIGFAMFYKFDENGYFLWDFAIDSRYQNKHYGTKALRKLLLLMKNEYSCKIVTTNYQLYAVIEPFVLMFHDNACTIFVFFHNMSY